ncbi:MAG: hypothetical protein WC291_01725 [Thermodesulfovibrionales bacterium]
MAEKQGKKDKITETDKAEFKAAPVIRKGVITMRNGKPTRVFFEDGKEVGSKDA